MAAVIHSQKFQDVIVAVHGIGEQIRFSTVRSVATRLATSKRMLFEAKPPLPVAPQPLGHFHSEVTGVTSIVHLDEAGSGRLTGKLARIGFAEVFWADIPQKVDKEGGTLEETKAWARTVVARAQALWLEHRNLVEKGQKRGTSAIKINPDFGLAAEVLDEIIETVYVLENLLFLADKAGLFKFDLKQVLEAYLGDVQLVAEFANYRSDIVSRFHKAMQDIYEKQREAGNADVQLHIVAHSEGAVVSFLGLLQAMSGVQLQPAGPHDDAAFKLVPTGHIPEWLKHVHGYMTIGSPIDKHLLLWPAIWEKLAACPDAAQLAPGQIRWRNYYDYGDPIGFKLETAREWVHKYWAAFEFEEKHDIGFARYLLPGKAHNDYWNDPDVFEHFVDEVVDPPNADRPVSAARKPSAWEKFTQTLGVKLTKKPPTGKQPGKLYSFGKWLLAEPPRTKWPVYVIGPTLPYVLSAMVLLVGVYLLCKSVIGFTSLASEPLTLFYLRRDLGVEATTLGAWYLFRGTVGLAGLIAGTTLFARLPRLAAGRHWFIAGSLAFLAGCALYLVVPARARLENGALFVKWLPTSEGLPMFSELAVATIGVLLVAFAVALIGVWVTRRPKENHERAQRWFWRGMRPLIFCGAVAVGVIVLTHLFPVRFGLHALTAEQIGAIRKYETPAGGDIDGRVKRKIDIIERAGFDKNELAQLFVRENDRVLARHLDRLELVRPLLGRPPAWPVVLAGLAFLYLWWLATLIFDLAFVWQRYVRGSVAHDRLEQWGAHRLGGPDDRRDPNRPRPMLAPG